MEDIRIPNRAEFSTLPTKSIVKITNMCPTSCTIKICRWLGFAVRKLIKRGQEWEHNSTWLVTALHTTDTCLSLGRDTGSCPVCLIWPWVYEARMKVLTLILSHSSLAWIFPKSFHKGLVKFTGLASPLSHIIWIKQNLKHYRLFSKKGTCRTLQSTQLSHVSECFLPITSAARDNA